MLIINTTIIMKKAAYLFIIGLIIFIAGPESFGQESSAQKDFKFTVKVNPLQALGGPFWIAIIPITGEYKVVGEYAFTKKMSFQVGASYIGPSVLLNLDKIAASDSSDIKGIKTSGFKFTGMYKYFLSRDLSAPEGFYVGPHFSFAKAKIESKDDPSNSVGMQKININLCIGYQLITSGGFTLDVFTGMGYISRKWTYENAEAKSTFDLGKNKSGVSIPFGFSFGYAF
jgi:hypothetical protein